MITANDIVKANEVLKNVVERTPLDFDRYLSEKYGATIYIKKKICKRYALLNCVEPTMLSIN
jgi:THD1: threonine dehydratase